MRQPENYQGIDAMRRLVAGVRRFFGYVAEGMAKCGLKGLASGVPFGGAIYEVCEHIYERYHDQGELAELRQDIQEVAAVSNEEVAAQADEVVEQVAGNQPEPVREALKTVLQQVPAKVRASLRSRQDPTGRSLPNFLTIDQPRDLVAFVPNRPARFRPGEQPLHFLPWELEELLGVGGYGEVWRARNIYMRSEPPVALKFCLDESAKKSLRNEVGAIEYVKAKLGNHSGIVRLRMAYLDAEPPCLEYDYVEGGDLGGLICEATNREVDANWGRKATKWFWNLTNIVAFAHQAGIVHCDLKPSNILISRTDENKFAFRIADFGIGGVTATEAIHETQTSSGTDELLTQAVRGAFTPLYASVQQMTRGRSKRPVKQDDVHALGVIWYQMITGELSIQRMPADSAEDVRERGLSEPLIALMGRCLSDKEARRPEDATKLAEELQSQINSTEQTAAASAKPSEPIQSSSESLPRLWTNPRGMQFAFVPKGTFWMSANNENCQKQVTIPHDMYVGVYQVTQHQWQDVMGNNPSYFSRTGRGKDQVRDISDDELAMFPVEYVSWDDCQEFLAKINAENHSSEWMYRLPTEEEWEYICRGGASSKQDCSYNYYFADTSGRSEPPYPPIFTNEISSNDANFDRNLGRPCKVGSYRPNALGVYDMHGNVWEWTTTVGSGGNRVLRGGGWLSYAWYCRSACRDEFHRSLADGYVGFRCARVPKQ